ncbi:MAG: hypothetical protein AB1555_00530 [Nitrospirota bacterium]
MCARSRFATHLVVIGGIGLAALLAVPSLGEASCAGLKGDDLQRCLAGELKDPGPAKILFYDQAGKSIALDQAVVTRSMDEVCRTIGRDGLFTAYKNDGPRRSARIWKEVSCRSGRVDGLWKEHFPSDNTLTILFYDASGKAVKQALYYNGRLIRESPIGGK